MAARRDICRVKAHRAEISALTFSPDGRRLVSASEDGTALVWDVTARQEERPRQSPIVGSKESRKSEAQPPLQTPVVRPRPSEHSGRRGIGKINRIPAGLATRLSTRTLELMIMRRQRAFRPALSDTLEGRIALSSAAAAVGHQAAVDAGDPRPRMSNPRPPHPPRRRTRS